MDLDRWTAVDEYVTRLLAPHDEVLDAGLEESAEAGLPAIQVSPPQGKLLHLLARAIGAGSVLEFGTLGGYSTIWLARALPAGGRLITLEADPAYAEVARRNLERANLDAMVDLRVGPALETLPQLEAEGAGPFDFVFIDADKVHTPDYFAWSVERVRPGGLIFADNVVRGGNIVAGGTLAAPSEDPGPQAQRRLHEMIAADARLDGTTIQTVGTKGHDGFTLVVVEA